MKFNKFGFFQHGGYSYLAGQFASEDWTSQVQFFPADGTGDHEGCWASARKTAENFVPIAEATGAVSIDGGVRNSILNGAVEGLLARYGTTREEVNSAWKAEQENASVPA